MDLIFGSPLDQLVEEIEPLRIQSQWRDILDLVHSFRQGSGNDADIKLDFYEVEALAELHCSQLQLAKYCGTRDDHVDTGILQEVTSCDFRNDNGDQEVILNASADILSLKGEKEVAGLFDRIETSDESEKKRQILQLSRAVRGKLEFLDGNLDAAYERFKAAELDDSEFLGEQNPRTVKILAEAFILQGLCLEDLHANGSQESSRQCYEIATILMLHLETLIPEEYFTGDWTAMDLHLIFIGPILAHGLFLCVDFEQKHGNLRDAFARARWFLQAMRKPVTRIIRIALCSKLLELLIRHIGKETDNEETIGFVLSDPGTDNPSSTKAPLNFIEEIGVLLKICFSLVEEEVILNDLEFPQFAQAANYLQNAALRILDFAAITSARFGWADFLEEDWDQLMTKLHTDSDHTLLYSNTLIQLKKYKSAFCFIRHCIDHNPDAELFQSHIQAAFLSMEHLGDFETGKYHSIEAKKLRHDHYLPHLFMGICYAEEARKGSVEIDGELRARSPVINPDWERYESSSESSGEFSESSESKVDCQEESSSSESDSAYSDEDFTKSPIYVKSNEQPSCDTERLSRLAMDYFLRAQKICDDDFRLYYNMALHSAFQNDLEAATVFVDKSLELNCDFVKGHHLKALILSALGRNVEAAELLESAANDNRGDISLWMTFIELVQKVRGTERALEALLSLLADFPEFRHILECSVNNSHDSQVDSCDADAEATGDTPTRVISVEETVNISSIASVEMSVSSANAGGTDSGVDATDESSGQSITVTGMIQQVFEKVTQVITGGTDEDDLSGLEVDDTELLTAVRYPENELTILAKMAELYLESDPEKSLMILNKLHKYEDHHWLLNYVRAKHAYLSGEPGEALHYLCLRLQRKFAPAWNLIIRIAVESGDLELADIRFRIMLSNGVRSKEAFLQDSTFLTELDCVDVCSEYLESTRRLVEPVRPFDVLPWFLSG